MPSAGTVSVDFAAETAKFNSQIGQLEARLKKTEGAFTSLGSIARSGLAFLGGTAIVGFLRSQADAADSLGKTADRLKENTTSLRAYQIASQEAGVSVESSNKILQDQQKRLGEASAGTGEAAKFIKILGLSIDDLRKQSPTELFRTYSEAINSLSSRSEQLAATNALMGRSAVEAFNLIQAGAPALDEAREFTERFGLALDRVSIKQIEAANDTFGRLSLVSQAAGQRIAAGLSPAIEFFSNKLLDATGNTESLQQRMEQFGAVAIAAFEIVANGARALEAAFFGIAAGAARVLQFLTFGDVSESFAAAVDANLAKATSALSQIKSIEQIQQTVTKALEDSRAKAEAAVAAQQAADAAAARGGQSLGGESITLSAQQQADVLQQIREASAQRQIEIEQEVTAVTQEQLSERVYATNAANDAMVRRAEESAATEIALRKQAADAGIGAIRLLATNSKTFSKLSKALDIAAAIRNTYLAVTKQLTSGDPYTAVARAVAVGAFGAAQVAAIARTPDEASFGTVTTISGGGPIGGVNSAFTSGASDQDQQGAQSVSTVQVIIQGNLIGNREFIDEMIEEIKGAVDDRDVVLISTTSRNAKELLES